MKALAAVFRDLALFDGKTPDEIEAYLNEPTKQACPRHPDRTLLRYEALNGKCDECRREEERL